MKENKRPLTLTGAILNIIAFSISTFSSAMSIFALLTALTIQSDILEENVVPEGVMFGAISIAIIIYLIRIAIQITGIVLSSKLIKISKMNVQDYNSKKGLVIAVFCIDILIVAFGVISKISSLSFDVFFVFLVWVMYILSAVFINIDLNKNNKEMISNTLNVVTQAQMNSETDKIDKLSELNKMKENGLISEEEFETMKQNLMK